MIIEFENVGEDNFDLCLKKRKSYRDRIWKIVKGKDTDEFLSFPGENEFALDSDVHMIY